MNRNDDKPPSWLFLCRKPPYGNCYGNACLELLLTAAAFDQEATLAFAGDGIWQLLAGQDSAGIGLKDQSRLLPALELYEVKTVLVEAEALAERGIAESRLLIPATPVSSEELSRRMAAAGRVLVY